MDTTLLVISLMAVALTLATIRVYERITAEQRTRIAQLEEREQHLLDELDSAVALVHPSNRLRLVQGGIA